jgi:Fe-S cluster biogenesis protein NfuA
MTDAEARERAARLEQLLEALEALPATARDTATETVATLLDLYGEGLARIVARVPGDALADDEVVAHLLMVHDLHPVALEQRVEAALDEVRPYLRSHGGEVQLVQARGGVVRLRLQGSCSGCPASRTTLELAVEEAIRRAVPEVEAIEAEDGHAEPSLPPAAFDACPLPMVGGGAA